MLKRDGASLVALGANMITAFLCVPTEYPNRSGFYRAVILFIINIFVTEIPKWQNNKKENGVLIKLQSFLFILGLVLISVGFLNMGRPYTIDELPQPPTIGTWIYFGFAMVMLFISIIGNLEAYDTKEEPKKQTPTVSDLDPSKDKP